MRLKNTIYVNITLPDIFQRWKKFRKKKAVQSFEKEYLVGDIRILGNPFMIGQF